MIYTITFNPAIDYVIEMQNFQVGEINRSKKEYLLPGGKGINVSIVLKAFDVDSTALGFVAGFVGEEIEKKLKEYGIKTDFLKIEDFNSRINVKIQVPDKETAINANGPVISNEYIELLYKKLEIINDDDVLVLSGSVPKGMKEDIYQNICEKLKDKNVKIIVDSTGELLLKTLKYKPFLVKPNQDELGEMFNVKISNQEEVVEYAKKLQKDGARNVLVSMGNKGAILIEESERVYKKDALNTDTVINTVGAGDSMVAGFIAGYLKFNDYEKALETGIVAATATTHSMFLATKEDIYKILSEGGKYEN